MVVRCELKILSLGITRDAEQWPSWQNFQSDYVITKVPSYLVVSAKKKKSLFRVIRPYLDFLLF